MFEDQNLEDWDDKQLLLLAMIASGVGTLTEMLSSLASGDYSQNEIMTSCDEVLDGIKSVIAKTDAVMLKRTKGGDVKNVGDN